MNKVFCGVLIVLSVTFSYSQNNEEEVENEVDLILNLLFEDEEDQKVDDLLQALFKEQKELEDLITSFSDFKFLYLSANYTSDTYFGGRDIGWSEYNFRPQVTYISGKGFFGGISGAYYEGNYFDPKWNYTAFNVGYGISFGKQRLLRLSGSYAYYLYSKPNSNPLTNTVSLGLSLRNKKRTLSTRISFNESFGSESLFQISWSGYYVLNIINKKNYRLQFRPRVALLWAEQTAYFNTGETEIVEYDGDDYEVYIYDEKDVFDLMNAQLNLPLLFSTKKWDVEVGFNSNFPYEIGDETNQKNNNFFNISIGYLLEL